MEADFGGWATKAGLECSDGRTITPEAFKHMDGIQVPLVWQHGHDSPTNVLGHAVLEARPEGVYARGFFNDTPAGVTSKALVKHKDVNRLSIWANQLTERVLAAGKKSVLHGMICEVSLVLKGANPGAFIDYVNIAHGDGSFTTAQDEAIITTGIELDLEFGHAAAATTDTTTTPPAADDTLTVQDVYDAMTPEEQAVVHYLVGVAEANGGQAQHSDGSANTGDANTGGNLEHTEGNNNVTNRNVFESGTGGAAGGENNTLSHADVATATKNIFELAFKNKASLRATAEDYALAHGINSIDVLFPEFKNVGGSTPEFNSRRMAWVQGVLDGVSRSPFSRVKTISADITLDDARAKGYVKGTLKKEEWFSVSKRTTTPTTIYKKQKLDRDDIVDITDFHVVAWMKGEMSVMLKEEIARAILIGDGRAVDDDDKIKDPVGASSGEGIRSIANDHELYVTTLQVNIDDAGSNYNEVVEAILRGMRFYKGTGTPTLYTTLPIMTEMLLAKDSLGRRYYNTKAELVSALMVADIVPVEVMESLTDGTIGILVNLVDYNIGNDRGGEVNLFDFFDIDYNQMKYLIETRLSGALTKIKSAILIKKTSGTNVLATPTMPTFNAVTGALTIPTVTGVVYKHGATTVNAGGSPYTVVAGTPWVIDATPASGYYFFDNAEDQWTFATEA